MTAAAETAPFPRKPLPKRFCNLDRVLYALEARGLDGIVATVPTNVFYLRVSTASRTSPTSRACVP